MSESRTGIFCTLALASALALSACGKSTPPPAAPPAPAHPPVATPAPAPAPMSAVHVGAVTLGNALGPDGKIAAPATTFAPKDTIYAVVPTTAMAAGTQIVARWTYQGGQVVSEEPQTLGTAAGPNTTTLHIAKPDGFPVGNYALDILVDGKSVSTTSFSVK
jgi:hypothetical protein